MARVTANLCWVYREDFKTVQKTITIDDVERLSPRAMMSEIKKGLGITGAAVRKKSNGCYVINSRLHVCLYFK